MPQAPIAADVDEPLDVHLHVLTQVALDLPLLLDHVADPADLVLGQILDLHLFLYSRLAQNAVASGPADSEDVDQGDLDPLVLRQVDTGHAGHSKPPIPGAACAWGSRK